MNKFIKDQDNIYINAMYAEAYIPESLFGDPTKDATIASEYSDGIKTIGMFYMKFFDSDEDLNRDNQPAVTFNYPNTIITYPSEYETQRLDINGVEDRYRILKYNKGDIMMNSFIKQDSENCEMFLKLLTSGKMPKLEYNDILIAWIKNFEINGLDPSVPAVIMQVIISEMCRYTPDPTKQFRKVAGKKDVDISKYVLMSMNDVSSYSSVMSALTFERFSDKLTNSLTMTKLNQKQNKSPIEKVLSM